MWSRHTSDNRDVAERPIPKIAIEDIASDARDEEVRKPIVVEIRCRGAHHVAVPLHAGVLGPCQRNGCYRGCDTADSSAQYLFGEGRGLSLRS